MLLNSFNPQIAHPKGNGKQCISNRSRLCIETEQQHKPVSPLNMYDMLLSDGSSQCSCINHPIPCVCMSSIFISVSPCTRPHMRDMKKTQSKHMSRGHAHESVIRVHDPHFIMSQDANTVSVTPSGSDAICFNIVFTGEIE